MKYCPNCGASNKDQAHFCTNCGSALMSVRRHAEDRGDETILFSDVAGRRRQAPAGNAPNGSAQLIFLDFDGRLTTIPLESKRIWLFGRITQHNKPDFGTTSPIVSREQGVFIKTENGWIFRDYNKKNSTFLNDTKLNGQEVHLRNLDVLKVDSDLTHNPNAHGVCMVFLTTPTLGRWKAVGLSDVLRIGRGTNNDIQIPEPYISWHHCEIRTDGTGCRIIDLNSLSGTWVNGKRIREKVLREKDIISICDRYFIYTDNTLIYNETSSRSGVLLKAHINKKTVAGNKVLLRDIDIEINKGEMVALLGGSGAGKTTLMDCLNGMNTKGVDGDIRFEGEDLVRNFGRFKYMIASVPQQSTFHDKLTVEREMTIAAQLRLPDDTTKTEIKAAVDRVIKQLGLSPRRRTRICKCSGGEQKRVNIGMDLVASKKLYCLDEPDAGLDSNSIRELFGFLKKMAEEDGKTFIIIIHNIAEIDMFDKVIMLGKKNDVGRLACMGTPQQVRDHFGCEISGAYKLLADDPGKYIRD